MRPVDQSTLWDNWTVYDETTGVFHRFVLSAPSSASTHNGAGAMSMRDRLAFIRRFTSRDGVAWTDRGSTGIDGWSGSAIAAGGRIELFFTAKGERQRIVRATLDSRGNVLRRSMVVDPYGRDASRADELGYALGRGDGYFPAFRDPFVWRGERRDQPLLLWAAKARLPQGAVVPAVGWAMGKGGALEHWELNPPMPVRDAGGVVRGQIEVPVLFAHGDRRYLVFSHSQLAGGTWTRSVRLFLDEDGDWRPFDGREGILLPPTAGFYGLHVFADPRVSGGLLASAFHIGRERTIPTELVPVAWSGARPRLEFSGAPMCIG